MVLSAITLQLLFSHKLALRLLTHDDWLAKLLRLSLVAFSRRNFDVIWLLRSSDLIICYLKRLLSSLSDVVVLKQRSSVNFLNDYWIFHSLHFLRQIDEFIRLSRVLYFSISLKNQILSIKLRPNYRLDLLL